MYLKCLLFLERSDSFLAVFLPFIIRALKLHLNRKISAEGSQLNGKSCCTMFQLESFLSLVANVSDFFISWRTWENGSPNQGNDLRIIGNSSKNQA